MATGDDYMIKKVLQHFTPQHAVEVGVAKPRHSLFRSIIKTCKRIQLFEPNPLFYNELLNEWGKLPNVEIHNVAIVDDDGLRTILLDGPTTMVAGANGPLNLDPNRIVYKDSLKKAVVNGRKFSHYDDGTIDFLVVDAEGCEKYVFETLVSRPQYICVELNEHSDIIRDPENVKVVREWIDKNNYIEIVRYVGDSIFKRK